MNVDVVILAGGGGTRLWPLSTSARPKQFLPLPGSKTLIEQAVARARKLTQPDRIWICTVAQQVSATRKVLSGWPKSQIIPEPFGQNSGPAAALATVAIQKKRKRPTTVLLLPADHYIPDVSAFSKFIKTGIHRASKGESLITFGLKVTSPRSDFGYIEAGTSKKSSPWNQVLPVRRFVEKPPLPKARQFSRSGKHFWNSGIFVWRSDFFIDQMKKHSPAIIRNFQDVDFRILTSPAKMKGRYRKLPNLSIDYALMEKSRKVEVVPSTFSWSDLGTWGAVHEAVSRKASDNLLLGKGAASESKGNLVVSRQNPVYLFGVDDLVVVQTEDAVMVTTKKNSRELKKYRKKIGV